MTGSERGVPEIPWVGGGRWGEGVTGARVTSDPHIRHLEGEGGVKGCTRG